jgi:hypothetical protein
MNEKPRMCVWLLALTMIGGCGAQGLREVGTIPSNLPNTASGLVIRNTGPATVMVSINEVEVSWTSLTSAVPGHVAAFYTVPPGTYRLSQYSPGSVPDGAPNQVVTLKEDKCYEWQIGR